VTKEQQKAAVGGAVASTQLALVSMSPSQIEGRNDVLRRFQDLKRDVASFISSAKRLGLNGVEGSIDSAGSSIAVASHPRTTTTATRSSSALQSRNQSLSFKSEPMNGGMGAKRHSS
jgi:hypothetical protein